MLHRNKDDEAQRNVNQTNHHPFSGDSNMALTADQILAAQKPTSKPCSA